MNETKRFSPEMRERAVRMVHEQRGEYPSQGAAVESIAPKVGCVPQTLLKFKRQKIDAGVRERVTSSEAQRVKELEREVKELHRANEILKRIVNPTRCRRAGRGMALRYSPVPTGSWGDPGWRRGQGRPGCGCFAESARFASLAGAPQARAWPATHADGGRRLAGC